MTEPTIGGGDGYGTPDFNVMEQYHKLKTSNKRLLDALRAAKEALRFAHGQYTCAEGAVDDALAMEERT